MHIRSRQMERPGKVLGRRGAGALHPALNDSTDRFIPFLWFLCANSVDHRTVLGGWEDRANRGDAFGGNPPGYGFPLTLSLSLQGRGLGERQRDNGGAAGCDQRRNESS